MVSRSLRTILLFLLVAGAAGAAEALPRIVRSEFLHEPGAYPACHAATLVETSGGTLLAAWFGGSGESRPDVRIYLRRFEGGAWTPEVAVADGRQTDGSSLPTWNPVLFQPRDGPLLLFYKVGPSPARWWGEFKTSSDDGRTWSAAHRLPAGVLGPIKNKPIQLADGTLLCGSSTEDPAPGGKGWQVQMERTPDLGRTWRVIGPLNTRDEFNAIQPALLTHADGRIQILCRTMEKRIATSWSRDGGLSWTRLQPTALRSPNSGLDAVTLRDGRQLLVYNGRSSTGAAPAAVGEADRCPLDVSLSDNGESWRRVLTLEDRPLPAGYAYPAVIQTRDGLVHIVYTWNRARIKHVVLDVESTKG